MVDKIITLFFSGFVFLTIPGFAIAQQIEWEVLNRFPLFKNAEDFQRLKNAWAPDGSASGTINSKGFTSKLRSLLPLDENAWQAHTGTYDQQVLFRNVHEIEARVTGLPNEAICDWSIDGHPAQSAPCERSGPLKVLANRPFEIRAKPAGHEALVRQYPAIVEHLIVALGDSFGSGEGNPDYPAVLRASSAEYDWYAKPKAASYVLKDARWWDETCHRSMLSWPSLSAMSQAIAFKHEVVQFASFACSGAEIYDGILRAQLNPTGAHGVGTTSESAFLRDGGVGYHFQIANERTGGGFEPLEPHNSRVRLSQQHALSLLLCSEEKKVGIVSTIRSPAATFGVREAQNYFGEFLLYGCSGVKRKVDRLLLSIGGNDVGFSGIVAWLLTPSTVEKTFAEVLVGARSRGLEIFRKKLSVVSPENAAYGIRQLPELYASLSKVLEVNAILPEDVFLLDYPDPTTGDNDLQMCNARTRDGNVPMQVRVRDAIGNANFLFGINPSEYRAVGKKFIAPLRSAQTAAAKSLGWSQIDSQLAINSGGKGGRGYCAVSTECSKKSCPSGDLVRFWEKPKAYSTEPPLKTLADFDAYDATRARGLRYGNDALLTGVAKDPNKKGMLRPDWFTNIAHPTGNIHALIADGIGPLRKN